MKNVLKKTAMIVAAVCLSYYAEAFEGLKVDRESLSELKDARADNWSVFGKTVVIRGNVYIPFGDMIVYADNAVIDMDSRDAEITGNIRAYQIRKIPMTLTIDELIQLQSNPDFNVVIDGYTTDPLGVQKVKVTAFHRGDHIKAERLAGNLDTGVIEFNDVEILFQTFVAKAARAVRKPGGAITLEDAEVTSCSYMTDDNAHYSFAAGKVNIFPHETAPMGISNKDSDLGEHSFWAYNVQLKVYGMPVMWVPVFYKPKDESPGLFGIQMGDNSDWGFYFLMYKRFDLTDNPYSSVKILADYYTMRGFGYGADLEVVAPDSKTEVFAYGIYDLHPYHSNDIEDVDRLEIPHARYDFRISNVTHVTPRLDFRGHFELLSDMYFLDDFYRYKFNNNPEPATFAALEYQFDRLSTALYVRPRVNDFFTTVERLPEFRIDVPRQQVFGTNLYYQSESSVDYLRMRWREFDKRPPKGWYDPDNYESFRFDTVHFLYYPIRLGGLNIIPRAGGRMTVYSNTSEGRVTNEDLNSMFVTTRPEGFYQLNFNQYDNDGGAVARFIGEIGVEANTKFSRSWQNVRNAFWRLDGLRHVIEPYVNYTFIPTPSVNREHIYYFDDIDRIQKQNFFRLGVRNSLQTRRGSFGNEEIYEIFRMENYWDLHLQPEDGMNSIGDFCTKLEFTPGNGFSIDSLISIDAGNNNDHEAEANRRGRFAGRPGMDNSWLNMWEINLRYELFKNCQITVGYIYNDEYATRSAYSMGSTLSMLQNGSYFDKYYNDRSQKLRFGISLPLSMDNSFRGSYDIYYDFEEGTIREQRVRLVKTLHCWEIAGEFMVEKDYDDDGDSSYDYSFMVTAYLTGLLGPAQQAQSAVMQGFSEMQRGGSSGFNL